MQLLLHLPVSSFVLVLVVDATVQPAPTPTLKILLLGENGAADEKLVRGRVFILCRILNEANMHRATAEEEIKKMTTSFGGEVKRSISKNTTYLLTGKSADTSKIKSATERQVEVVNLRRLQ